MPDPATFVYTFDRLSEITETFLEDRGFDRCGLYVRLRRPGPDSGW
jgi:hypothetical protein